jgi:hypothetical protein
MREFIDAGHLPEIIAQIERSSLIATAEARIAEGRRFGLIAEVGSLESGAFHDWPAPIVVGGLDEALLAWKCAVPRVQDAFSAEIMKISLGIADGRLEATGDCPYARALVLVEPDDPDDDPNAIHGFDVSWDFACPPLGILKPLPVDDLGLSWADLFR